MAALDFMKLLTEERRKAKARQSNGRSAGNVQGASSSSSSSSIIITTTVGSPAPRTNCAHSAVDMSFRQLHEEDHRCATKGSLQNVWYMGDFCTKQQSKWMLDCIFDDANAACWVQLKRRRLQCWGGEPPGFGDKLPSFRPEPLPEWAVLIAESLVGAGIFQKGQTPNHLLVNAYERGEGILPHTDGPFYFPRTATLSLSLDDGPHVDRNNAQEGALMIFSPRLKTHEIGAAGRSRELSGEFVLRNRSILVFDSSAYLDHTHAIEERATDVASEKLLNGSASESQPNQTILRPKTRVSLTFRYIPTGAGPCCNRKYTKEAGSKGDDTTPDTN